MTRPTGRFCLKMCLLSLTLWGGAQGALALIEPRWSLMVDGQAVRCLPDRSVYLLIKGEFVPKNGDIMAFKARGMEPFYPEGKPIGKLVAAIPGDRIRVTETAVTVNEAVIVEHLVPKDGVPKDGVPTDNVLKESLVVQPMHRTLTEGEFFVVGTHPRSYDSRYWGTVKASQVLGRLVPLW